MAVSKTLLDLLSSASMNPAEPFSLLAEGLPLLVWAATSDGRMVYANQRWLEYAGIDRAQLGGWSWNHLVHSDDLPRSLEQWSDATAALETLEIKHRLRRSDGQYRWFRVRVEPILGQARQLAGWLGTCVESEDPQRENRLPEYVSEHAPGHVSESVSQRPDVSIPEDEAVAGRLGPLDHHDDLAERQRVEEELRQSEARFRVLAEAAPSIAVMMDADGQSGFANSRWEEYFGISFSEACRRSWHGTIHPEDMPRVLQRWAECTAIGEPFEVEYRLPRKDGELRWHLSRFLPLRNDAGSVTAWCGTITDIHELKVAERDLAATRERLELALSAGEVATWIWEIPEDHLYADHNLAMFFNISGDDVCGGPLEAYLRAVQPEDRDGLTRLIQSVIDGSGSDNYEAEYRVTGLDGVTRWVLARGRVQRDPDGRAIRLPGVVLDITDRKRAEAEAESQRRMLDAVLDALPVGVLISNKDGSLLRDNAANRAIWGFPPETRCWEQYDQWVGYWPDSGRRIQAHEWAMARALLNGETVVGELVECERFDNGQRRYFLNNAAPVRDADGQVIGGVVAELDVTEQREAEQALRGTEERLRLHVDNSPLAVVEWDADFRVRSWTGEAERMFGWSADEVLGKQPTDWAFVHEEDATDVAQIIQGLMSGEVSRNVSPNRNYCKNGEVLYCEWYNSVLRDEDGRLRSVLSLVHDVTVRQHTEMMLRESEERFRTLADNISQFAWMADENGWVFWYNQRWYDYTGTTLEQMQGWGWTMVHHPDHVERVVKRIQHSWDTGEVWEDEFPLRGRDGSYRWFLSRALPIRDENGKIVRWFGTNTDITDQRNAQDELRKLAARLSEADRRKDEFLATLAHELRNPLAPIRTGLELMKRSGNDPVLREEVRGTMERQTEQLVRLVDDLLDVSRITLGRLKLKRNRVMVQDVIHRAVETARPLVDEARHELRLTIPEKPSFVQGDPHRLAQVLSNLLNNAVRYTPSGGRIALAVAEREGEVVITVQDNGIGVPPAMLDQIFEMFTQVESDSDATPSGLGIGLTLAKSLVELHGGRIRVDSPGAGRGCTFGIHLPATDPPVSMAPSKPSTSERGTVKQRVLVVDDNDAAAKMLTLLIASQGHEVYTAHDGEQAVQFAADHQPHVILMDIGMPRMNGYEAARRIRQQPRGNQIRLIALTGWGQEEDKRRTKEAGFDYHLVKPPEPAKLYELLAWSPQAPSHEAPQT